ncbi:MAG: aminopeptidase [Patescibacteria group bacterium]
MQSKLQQGAFNAINKCLEVSPTDRVVIITDLESKHIGDALKLEVEKLSVELAYFTIEDFVSRPAKELPQQLVAAIKNFAPTVSIYAADGKEGELPTFRRPLTRMLMRELNCKHAHMIGITTALMEDGLNQDYDQIYKVTHNVASAVKDATKITVTCPYGTNLVTHFDPTNLKWVLDDGKIPYGHMHNLPSGEVYTSPVTSNGTYMAWVLGDHFASKVGVLEHPLTVVIVDGYITNVSVDSDAPAFYQDLVQEFTDYISEYENGKRLGEFGIGTLVGLTGFVGNLLQDEKFPGSHIAFGHPYPHETGQTWDSESHIDIIAKDVTITFEVNGEIQTLMRNGVFESKYLN